MCLKDQAWNCLIHFYQRCPKVGHILAAPWRTCPCATYSACALRRTVAHAPFGDLWGGYCSIQKLKEIEKIKTYSLNLCSARRSKTIEDYNQFEIVLINEKCVGIVYNANTDKNKRCKWQTCISHWVHYKFNIFISVPMKHNYLYSSSVHLMRPFQFLFLFKAII